MNIPNFVDLTPEGEIVSVADLGDKGYAENIMCTLTLMPDGDSIEINYYREDDGFLDHKQVEYIIKNTDKL